MLRPIMKLVAVIGLALGSGCYFEERPWEAGIYATGLTNPRGLVFGPSGELYVAEAGTGGSMVPTGDADCPININIYSPYTAGFSGQVTRVSANGTKQIVAGNLPSMTDAFGASYGPTDLAFVGGSLYVLIEMGGCSHALPDSLHLPAILRVNADGSTTNVADLGAWHRANPPHFIKDSDPATTDQEPGGVFHSMIAVGAYLYVVETNRGFLLRVDPATGAIEKQFDMSVDNAEHNPVVMTRHNGNFYVGTFGEDEGPAELALFDENFYNYALPYDSLHPLVGLAWRGEKLYGVEIFPYDDAWTPNNANFVMFDRETGARVELLSKFASLPNGLVEGPDGALYTSNWGISSVAGDGQVLRLFQQPGAGWGAAPIVR
ncbi:MAG: ScyD/ScyE family protein [Steroidobacteraceae bacterium]